MQGEQDPTALLERARDWAAHDPDPATRQEIEQLVAVASTEGAQATAARADLADRFAGPLTFGTAGLRGVVAAGESRMNTAVVIRATAGLAQYLKETVGPGARVVLGCDARHGSGAFLTAAAQVLAAAGARPLVLPQQLPTPVTAFAVRTLQADAGIMITASHNPPQDNGYKVYLGGRAATAEGQGVQIVPPADALIAECIAETPPADQVPRTDQGVEPVDPSLVAAYRDRAASRRGTPDASDVSIVLTPMHGVGGAIALDVLAEAGFADVTVVPEQARPDPDFPTIPFPNPEEPGAIDLALALAQDHGADVVIALDPDADRCSVAIPLRAGGWRQLTGDEIGSVLGEQAAADDTRAGGTLANSVVSSRLLERIATAHGLRHATTLTGFKWIARTPDLRFGYEEAIGYCTDPEAVRDKDGIGAAVRVATLVHDLAVDGRTVEDLLDDLARRHGLYATAPLSIRVEDLSRIGAMMADLRREPLTVLADSPVTEVDDLAEGSADLPPTDGLSYLSEAGDRVIIRPSGTEPKLKCYLEVVLPVGPGDEIPREAAVERLQAITTQLRERLGV
jgi:phosphomannomutase